MTETSSHKSLTSYSLHQFLNVTSAIISTFYRANKSFLFLQDFQDKSTYLRTF